MDTNNRYLIFTVSFLGFYLSLINRYLCVKLQNLFLLVFLIFFQTPVLLYAQNIIIPQPKSFLVTTGNFKLNSNTIISMNDSLLQPQANYLKTELQKADSIAISLDKNEAKASIFLQLITKDQLPGSYTLKIEPQKITITSSGNEGIFYGIISLLQMIRGQPPGKLITLPNCEISDAPRYEWRGFMLDESRHFFGKKKVKQLLDWMAFYKLNRFHWHLTDADGWRIKIKKYPDLTLIGGIGNHTDSLAAAKFYTQDEIKEIVAYARDRFITIIPEVDMPGHATAANKAYPEYSGGSIPKYPNFTFDPSNEKTYGYLSDIVKETNALFPSHMLHLGGDEVALGMQAWAGRPAITEMLAKNKFTGLIDIEQYFLRRMADTVIGLNSKVLCWDEAVGTGLPVDKTIIFWWRQNMPFQLKLALQKNYMVVLCPRLPLYFDFVQDKTHLSGRKWNGGFNSLSEVYHFPDKQLPANEIKSKQVLGIQANLWTESISSEKRLDFMVFPRMAALSEAAWTDPALKDENMFYERLKFNFRLYDSSSIYYYDPFDPEMHPEPVDFESQIIKTPKHVRPHYHNHHQREIKGHHHGRRVNSHHQHMKNRHSKKAAKHHKSGIANKHLL